METTAACKEIARNAKGMQERRPDASRSRESGGYGIGLSMVRAIMEKHGGRVWAETTPDNRICFKLRFV